MILMRCVTVKEKNHLKNFCYLKTEEYLKNSKSWITKDKLKKEVEFKPKHDFIEDLDEIPFFDYDLCDINSVNPNITSFHNVAGDFGFHIMTSRGCPYLCTFCASHKTMEEK